MYIIIVMWDNSVITEAIDYILKFSTQLRAGSFPNVISGRGRRRQALPSQDLILSSNMCLFPNHILIFIGTVTVLSSLVVILHFEQDQRFLLVGPYTKQRAGNICNKGKLEKTNLHAKGVQIFLHICIHASFLFFLFFILCEFDICIYINEQLLLITAFSSVSDWHGGAEKCRVSSGLLSLQPGGGSLGVRQPGERRRSRCSRPCCLLLPKRAGSH